MICTKCGYENVPGAAFCNLCYHVLSDPSKPKNPQAEPAVDIPKERPPLLQSTPVLATPFRFLRGGAFLLLMLIGVTIFFANRTRVNGFWTHWRARQMGPQGSLAMESIFSSMNLNVAKNYLATGYDPNTVLNGSPILVMATGRYDIPIVELLLSSKADINAKDSAGRTAIMIASARPHIITVGDTTQRATQLELVKLLLKYKPDLTLTDNSGQTAIKYAYANWDNEIVKLLQEGGASDTSEQEFADLFQRLEAEKYKKDGEVSYALRGMTRTRAMDFLMRVSKKCWDKNGDLYLFLDANITVLMTPDREMVPYMIQCLGTFPFKEHGARALVSMGGAAAEPIVEEISKLQPNTFGAYSYELSLVISQIGAPMVNPLIRLLSSTNNSVCLVSILYLKDMGSRAKDALPTLRSIAFTHSDANIKNQAQYAVSAIEKGNRY